MCVAERLSGFCEAILNVDDLCKSNLRCCVSKETYDDDAPGALFIPNGSKPPPPVKRKTTKKPKVNKRKPPKRKGGDDCKGTCVTGFFALLCEDIDKSVECPGLQFDLSTYVRYSFKNVKNGEGLVECSRILAASGRGGEFMQSSLCLFGHVCTIIQLNTNQHVFEPDMRIYESTKSPFLFQATANAV